MAKHTRKFQHVKNGPELVRIAHKFMTLQEIATIVDTTQPGVHRWAKGLSLISAYHLRGLNLLSRKLVEVVDSWGLERTADALEAELPRLSLSTIETAYTVHKRGKVSVAEQRAADRKRYAGTHYLHPETDKWYKYGTGPNPTWHPSMFKRRVPRLHDAH